MCIRDRDVNLQAFYRALARLKRENPALKTGRVEFITASNGRVQFLRQSAGQTAMVFCNASREPWRVQYAGKLLFGGKLQAYKMCIRDSPRAARSTAW